jgi:hypothetical protein
MTHSLRHRRPGRLLVAFIATAAALCATTVVTPVAPAQADGLAGWAAGQFLSGAGDGQVLCPLCVAADRSRDEALQLLVELSAPR